MAHDAEDVAKVLRPRARQRHAGHASAPAGTSLNGQAQGDGILVDVRRHLRGIAVEDGGERVRVGRGTVLGHVNRVLADARPQARPRPGQHRHRLRRRRDRQQLRRDALRRRARLLQHGALADVRARRRGRRSTRPPPAPRSASPTPSPSSPRGLVEIRDEIRADDELAERIRAQVRDQEHDRLPALRVPRRRHAARDLPPPAGRLRGDARVHRRGDVRDRAAGRRS